MSQIRQMETNVYSLAEEHVWHLSETHLAELRERDARLSHRDAELAHAEQVVEEARIHVAATSQMNPAELFIQRQWMQSEYEQSLTEMAQIHEDRARLLAAQKAEQDKTSFEG